jgi:ferric-dicitrate binding protein FerR (iron transport regulator)
MNQEEILLLIKRYNEGACTQEEKDLLETWYANQDQLFQPELEESMMEQDLADISRTLPAPQPKKILWSRIAAAASLILCLGFGGYFLLHKQATQQIVKNQVNVITPGGNKAILTLANGRQIILANASNGKLAEEANTAIDKTADGSLVYHDQPAGEGTDLLYNTMSTPRGGQYHLTLADGTKVWLNSASSIKYPTAFAGNERKVELTGEAYFEVAHNAAKPFRIISNGQMVEVLGTHFNINAYPDENEIKTTLLQGSVKINAAEKSYLLKPGEQSTLRNGNVNIAAVDINEAVGWKNGVFYFNDASIESVMRQLSRWYDVDVKYEGQIKERKFSGEISRSVNASQILDALSFKKIHYSINGRTIIIKP